MVSAYSFTIAGIEFKTRIPKDLQLSKPNRPYEDFLKRPEAEARELITASISVDPPPDWDKMNLVFDSGVSWRLYVQPPSRHLVFCRDSDPADWLYAAELTGDPDRVTVYCSETLQSLDGGSGRIPNPVQYPLDQLLAMYKLASRGGLVFHAAGILLDERAIVFPGPSGAGKSTLMRQLENLPGAVPLSDDRMVVRHRPDGFFAYGTPWPGEAGIAVNRSGPLRGVCLLCKDTENRLEQATPKQALERLLPVASIPWYEPEVCGQILETLDALIKNTRISLLHFTPDGRVADLIGGLR